MWHGVDVHRLGPVASEHPRYRPTQLLGEGGFGVVYAAEDKRTGTKVALKLLHRDDPESLYRFHQEFRHVSQVSHENLVQLFELEEFRGRHFLTMPQLIGDELLTALEATPAAAREARLRALLRGVAEGLQALHDAGFLHRDVKPSNIFATDDGRAILLDFGLAHSMTERVDGRVQGTVAYMSPEQADSDDRVGPPSDWYGVGAVLYQALTGRPPFHGDSPLEVLVNKFQEVPRPVLEVAPEAPPDLAALADGLLAMEPEERPSVTEIRATLGLPPLSESPTRWGLEGATLPRVLGHQDLLDELVAAALAPSRAPAVWLLAGPSGMGKTTAAEVLRRRIEETPDGVFLHGRCGQGETVPFKGVEGLADALGNFIEGPEGPDARALRPSHLDELLRVFPTLQRVKGLGAGPRTLTETGLSPWDARRLAADALAHLLREVATRQRLTVFVDDLHWIDRDGAEFLALVLASGASPPPATFVFAYRPDELAEVPWVQTLFEAIGASELPLMRRSLPPLSPEDAAHIAEGALPHASPEVREQVVQAAQGNPRYLMELARDAAVNPAAPSEDGFSKLQAMLARRFQALGTAAAEILGLIALADTPLPLDVLAAAALAEENPALATHALRARHLIRGGFGDHAAQVDHEPIREAFRATVAPKTARALHHQLAHALEKTAAPAAQVAAHYRGAGEPAQEARFTIVAAEEAAEVLAFERAASLYSRAAEVRGELGEETYDLHLRRAELLVSAQRGPDAARAFLAAASVAPPGRAPLHRLHAAEQLLISGHVEQAYGLLNEVLPIFGLSLSSSSWRALAGVGAQRALLWVRRLHRDHAKLARGEDAIPRALLDQIDALLALGRSLAMLDSTRAAAVNTRAARLARRAGEPRRLRTALMLEVSFAAGTGSGKVALARKQLAALRALNEAWPAHEGPGLEATADGLVLALGQGDWAAARPRFAQGCELLRKTPSGLEADVAENFELVAAALMGDFAWLHETLLERLEDAERRGNRYRVVSLTCSGCHLSWLARGEPDTLLRRIHDVMDEWRRDEFLMPRYWELWARTRTALYGRDRAEDLEALEGGWKQIRRSGLLYLEAIGVDLWAARGLAALARHDRDGGSADRKALDIARKAAKQLAKIRHPNGPLRARLVRAGLYAAQGQPDKARASLEGLGEAFEAIQWRLHAAAARLRLGQVLGGSAGEAGVTEARQALRTLGVVDPDAMARVVAPEVVPPG